MKIANITWKEKAELMRSLFNSREQTIEKMNQYKEGTSQHQLYLRRTSRITELIKDLDKTKAIDYRSKG